MDIEKAIKERRSIRSYNSNPVEEKDLTKILNAARWAPSAGNCQPLEIVVIKKEKDRKKLEKAAYGKSPISEAPVTIVVCANIPRTEREYGRRGSNLYVIQDTAAATQNIMLMAYALGYSTCWIGAFNEEEVSRIIEAPEKIRPLVMITIGKSDEIPEPPEKRDLENIVHENSF